MIGLFEAFREREHEYPVSPALSTVSQFQSLPTAQFPAPLPTYSAKMRSLLCPVRSLAKHTIGTPDAFSPMDGSIPSLPREAQFQLLPSKQFQAPLLVCSEMAIGSAS
jgi:hypothetical protein